MVLDIRFLYNNFINRVFSQTRFRTTASLSCTQNHHSCTQLNPCGAKTVRIGVCENTLIIFPNFIPNTFRNTVCNTVTAKYDSSSSILPDLIFPLGLAIFSTQSIVNNASAGGGGPSVWGKYGEEKGHRVG